MISGGDVIPSVLDCRQTWRWSYAPAPLTLFAKIQTPIFFVKNKKDSWFIVLFFPYIHKFCRFFQIYARKGQPGFHSHSGVANILCVSKSMLFFCTSEQSLNGFFSQHINRFVPKRMADILTGFRILCPNMAGGHFLMFIPRMHSIA